MKTCNENSETQIYIYRRTLDENRTRSEQVNELMIVVNQYEKTIEKWETLQHLSIKEQTEAENTLAISTHTFNKRQRENERKIMERSQYLK